MQTKKIVMHIIGYIIGVGIFVILIPAGLLQFSQSISSIVKIPFIENYFLRILIALPFFIIGLLFLIWSNIALFLIGKGGPADGFNVAVSPRSEKLVISGPYRHTRNPMVFGAFFFYFAIGIYSDSLACMCLLVICYLLAIVYLKNTEEKRLLKDFGKDFLEYKKKVSMIIPFPKIKNP
jgi:protein-S-isoprenylcysteine O-methyltransferase Ste14